MPYLLFILLLLFSCDETLAPQDCQGVENGTAFTDDCAQCVGGTTGLLENYLMDCTGECGGDAIEDDCGTCNGNNSTCSGCTDTTACNYNESSTVDDGSCEYAQENFDCEGICTLEIDCAGVCGGHAVEDMCGTWDNNSSNDCELDCTGIWGGGAFIDDCDQCVGGTTGLVGNYLLDDCNVCNGGNSDMDECGECFGDNSTCTGCFDSEADNYDADAIIECSDCCEYIYNITIYNSADMGGNSHSFKFYDGSTDNLIFGISPSYGDYNMVEDIFTPREYLFQIDNGSVIPLLIENDFMLLYTTGFCDSSDSENYELLLGCMEIDQGIYHGKVLLVYCSSIDEFPYCIEP